eukprot:8816128-Pyramimonas_sp.AAC.1
MGGAKAPPPNIQDVWRPTLRDPLPPAPTGTSGAGSSKTPPTPPTLPPRDPPRIDVQDDRRARDAPTDAQTGQPGAASVSKKTTGVDAPGGRKAFLLDLPGPSTAGPVLHGPQPPQPVRLEE